MKRGVAIQLTTLVQPENALDLSVKWTSLNSKVATIDNLTGLISTVDMGSIFMVATTNDGNLADSCLITVVILAECIVILHDSIRIKKGITVQLTALVDPETATNQAIVWASSNPNIATIGSAGLVTGVEIGETFITVTVEDSIEARCCVVVFEDLNIYSVDNEKTVKIYPNPTKGILNIENIAPIQKIDLLDHSGKLIDTKNPDARFNYQLDLSVYSGGMYFCKYIPKKKWL